MTNAIIIIIGPHAYIWLKSFIKLLLKNQLTDGPETWYVASDIPSTTMSVQVVIILQQDQICFRALIWENAEI